VSTASTSALPTIDSLIAEKNLLIAEKMVLEGEKQELAARVRAGVSEALEVSLNTRIVAALDRITGLDARIRDHENSITAIQLKLPAPIIDYGDPALVCDRVVEMLRDAKVPIKADRGRFGDGERLASWALDGTHDRAHALATAREYIEKGNMSAKDRYGFAATWGVPGSGKSHLLDAIVENFRDRTDVLFLPATFNGVSKDVGRGVPALLVRIICAHWVGGRATCQHFEAVTMRLETFLPQLGTTNIVNAAVYDYARLTGQDASKVLGALLVDEIGLSGDANAVYMSSKSILSAQRRVVYTAVVVESVLGRDHTSNETKANTPITWLTLPRLTWRPDAPPTSLLSRFSALSGGHPRTVEFVRAVSTEPCHNYEAAAFFRQVVFKLSSGRSNELQVPMLAPALIGLKLRPTDRFDNVQFDAVVRAGVAMNQAIDEDDVLTRQVPILSLFFMSTIESDPIRQLVSLLFIHDLTGEQFTKLHAYWDTAVRSVYYEHRVALQCEQTMPLLARTSPRSPTIGKLALYRDVTMLHGSCVRVQTSDSLDVMFLYERLSDTACTSWTFSRNDSVQLLTSMPVGKMIVPATLNIAFDLATLYLTEKGEPHLLLIECKFSAAASTTVLGWPGDLDSKFANLKRDLPLMLANPEHLFTRSGITSARQVTYLVVPMRAITNVLCAQAMKWCSEQPVDEMFNAAILERDALLQLYGPTLKDAVAFTYK
jgi:hypothetical protein